MTGTYFTIMLRAGPGNYRQWYVEEMKKTNSLYSIHKSHNLVFDTFDECEDACLLKADNLGGEYIKKLPEQGKRYDRYLPGY